MHKVTLGRSILLVKHLSPRMGPVPFSVDYVDAVWLGPVRL